MLNGGRGGGAYGYTCRALSPEAWWSLRRPSGDGGWPWVGAWCSGSAPIVTFAIFVVTVATRNALQLTDAIVLSLLPNCDTAILKSQPL